MNKNDYAFENARELQSLQMKFTVAVFLIFMPFYMWVISPQLKRLLVFLSVPAVVSPLLLLPLAFCVGLCVRVGLRVLLLGALRRMCVEPRAARRIVNDFYSYRSAWRYYGNKEQWILDVAQALRESSAAGAVTRVQSAAGSRASVAFPLAVEATRPFESDEDEALQRKARSIEASFRWAQYFAFVAPLMFVSFLAPFVVIFAPSTAWMLGALVAVLGLVLLVSLALTRALFLRSARKKHHLPRALARSLYTRFGAPSARWEYLRRAEQRTADMVAELRAGELR